MHQSSSTKTVTAGDPVKNWAITIFALLVTEKTLLLLQSQEKKYQKIMLNYSNIFQAAAPVKRSSSYFTRWMQAILQLINYMISKTKTIQGWERP